MSLKHGFQKNCFKGTHTRDFHSKFLTFSYHPITNRDPAHYIEHFQKSALNSPRYLRVSITTRFRRKHLAWPKTGSEI
jgi:hypothetical protein